MQFIRRATSQIITPLDLLPYLANDYFDKIKEIEFSKYISGGQGLTLKRELFKLSLDNIREDLNIVISNLKKGEEVAVHSKVFTAGEVRYLPKVDFAFKNLDNNAEAICKKISKQLNAPLYLFNSGNSYHGYIINLLGINEWHKFLGSLLLLNPRNKPFEIVDSRWVGHSLENGFSALRISNNSGFYIQVPQFFKLIEP